jgi:hypothetical protein
MENNEKQLVSLSANELDEEIIDFNGSTSIECQVSLKFP